jgi:hypothetical protein
MLTSVQGQKGLHVVSRAIGEARLPKLRTKIWVKGGALPVDEGFHLRLGWAEHQCCLRLRLHLGLSYLRNMTQNNRRHLFLTTPLRNAVQQA